MIREVKTVEPALLIEAFQAVMDDPDKSDHIVTLVMHFGNRFEPETLMNIDYRLVALANIVKDDKPSPWVKAPKDKPYKLISEALLRAAAVSPLFIDDATLIGEIAFDADTFAKAALEASDTAERPSHLS